MYYYYKESCKAKTHSVAPPKKESKPKMTAKEWYEELYKLYDFVIHLDGKSLEDQHRVQQNHQLKNQYKRISMAVEAKG
jgi:protein-tyrosine-phosphatase